MVLRSLKTLKTLFGNSQRRAGSAHKHKEKNQNETSETPDSARENGDRASKMGHQVHPEHRPAITIDKVNVMVNLDGKWDKKDLETSPLGDELDPLEKVHISPVVSKEQPTKTVQNNNGKETQTKVHIASFTTSICHENRVSTDSVAFSDRDTWISGQSDKEVWMHSQSEKDSCQSDQSSFESDKSGSWVANESEPEDVKCSYSPRERPIGEDREHAEKTDVIKELLEKRVLELERLLEKEKRNDAHVQQEALQKELEKEKAQRKEVEVRLQEISRENEFAKMRLSKLQQDFIKLEEMVCGMIQYKSRMDWLQQEKNALSLTYETQLRKYQNYISNLEKENLMLLGEVKSLEASNRQSDDRERSLSQVLLERLRYLETENSSLVLETEQQRLQYERCLDEVANQVVQALLMQKGLREECTKLRKHVGDLEHHNRFLKLMFQKQINLSNDSAVLQACRPSSSGAENNYSNNFLSINTIQSPSLTSGKLLAKQTLQKGSSNHSSMATQTSHSEDSLESLASLCSEYSLHSNGSGSLHNNAVGINIPGMPQLSSPPLWIKECLAQCRVPVPSPRQSNECEDGSGYTGALANEGALKPSEEVDGLFESIWPGLQLRDLEEMVCSDDSLKNSDAGKNHDKSKSIKTQSKASSDGECSKEETKEKPDDEEEDGSLEQSPSLASLSEALDSSSSACLDAVETPNEEALNFVNLPLLVSSQKLNVGHNSVENVSKTLESFGIPLDSIEENVQQRIRDAVTRTIALRPKSLNLVPQHMSGKNVVQKELIGHHYDYPSLEIKNHPVCTGNMYTSPNAKSFPLHTFENVSCSSVEKCRHCDDKSDMNKKLITFNSTSSQCLCKSLPRRIDSTSKVTPPTGNHTSANVHVNYQTVSHNSEDSYKLSDSMISTDSIKDEGYSTMSSDVISEQQLGTSSVLKPATTCPETTSPTSSVATTSNISLEKAVGPQPAACYSADNKPAENVDLCQKEVTQDEDDAEEEIHGFENDLVQSLIIVKECKDKNNSSIPKCSSPIENSKTCSDISHMKSDKSKHVSIKEPVNSTLEKSSGEVEKKSINNGNASLILSTNRMVSLCAPQGFKARPPHITFPPPHNIEMADKGTETEPLNSKDINLSGSYTSLASVDSEGHEKFPPSLFESSLIGASEMTAGSQRSSFASASDSDCYELIPNSSLLLSCTKLNELKIVEDNDSDEFFMPILCKMCPEKTLQQICHAPVFKPRKINKSVSDSEIHLIADRQQKQFNRSASTCAYNETTHFSPRPIITTGSLEFLFDGRSEGGLWRSKATVSLADDEDELSKPHITNHDMSSWQFEMTGQSLTSLQSIASEEGECKREATACKLLTEEMLVNSDSDHESLIEDDSFSSSWPAVSENCLNLKKITLTKENHGWNLETVHEVSGETQQMEENSQRTSSPLEKDSNLSEGNSEWKEMIGGMMQANWLNSKDFPLPDHLSQVSVDGDPVESIQGSEDSDLRTVGTEFHRDFYHLCKVDSRSLNMSSKSLSVSEGGSSERDSTASRYYGNEDDVEKIKASVESAEEKKEQDPAAVSTETSANKDVSMGSVSGSSDKLDQNNSTSLEEVQLQCLPENRDETLAVVEEVLSDDSSQDGGEHVDSIVHCTLENKASTREKLEELTAMMAESCGADEEEDVQAPAKEQLMGSPGRKEGCTTSWIHVETDVDLTDPKARANLLDTMLASSSSSSSSECGEEPPEYHHLHQLHRYRRHRKATELENYMLRYIPPTRPSIIGRRDFFFRYGEQEQAAVASFDFLEDMSTSVSDFGSAETLNVNEEKQVIASKCDSNSQKEIANNFWSPKCSSSLTSKTDQPLETASSEHVSSLFRSDCNGSNTTLNSHDFDAPERLSLSDSCAESYSSSNQSLNAVE